MKKLLRQFYFIYNHHTFWLLPAGLIAVAWQNWRLWRFEKPVFGQKFYRAALPPLEAWPVLPTVSVLVAAWNEVGHIQRHIESFLHIRYPHKELILCAGGNDDTYERACQLAGDQVIVIQQKPGEGKQRALQRILPLATGSIIYFTDSDCLLDDDSFERVIHPLVLGIEQITTGSSIPSQEQLENPFAFAQASVQQYGNMHSPTYVSGLLGRNCAVYRELLEQSGWSHEPAPTGTDYVLAQTLIKTGARIRHIPESRISTEYPSTLRSYIRQQQRWLRNLFLVGYRFQDRFHFRRAIITSSTGILLFTIPFLSLFLGKLAVLGWILTWLSTLFRRVRYYKLMLAVVEVNHKNILIVFLNLFKIFVADIFVWATVLFSLLNPGWRKQW